MKNSLKPKKTYKEQVENHNKTFTDQLKVRNEEFQKLQITSTKQLEDLQKNFQEQQKQRQAEMESYKKEIAILHEKNMQSAINEKTASLRANLETLKQDNIRLNLEVKSNKTDYVKVITAFILAVIIGFIMAKFV
jgi:exodeoxyribonuclease VII large subunit